MIELSVGNKSCTSTSPYSWELAVTISSRIEEMFVAATATAATSTNSRVRRAISACSAVSLPTFRVRILAVQDAGVALLVSHADH